MKNKHIVFVLILMISIAPMLLYASGTTPPTADEKKAIDWAQGDSVIEDWFVLDFLDGLKDMLWSKFDMFIDIAKALGASLCMLFLASKTYEVLSGDKKLEVLPLFRPFALLLVIINWNAFCSLIEAPAYYMAVQANDVQRAEMQNVNELRMVRFKYQMAVQNSIFDFSSESEVAKDQAGELVKNEDKSRFLDFGITEGIIKVVGQVYSLHQRLELTLQLKMTQMLEMACLWILRLAVYVVFALQVVYTGILVIFGPISVSMSIIPMFRDSFGAWVGRFITVNLYLAIAFIILFIGNLIQHHAMESEIERYKELIPASGVSVSLEKLAFLSGNGFISFGSVIIGYLLTAVIILTVPSISSWIVNSSGATSAMGGASRGVRGVSNTASKGAAMVRKAFTKV